MKVYKILFIFSLLILFSINISAQPKNSVAKKLAPILNCFTENEAKVAAISNSSPLSGNADTLRRLNESLPVLKILIGCAEKGSKISGLPLKTRRAMLDRKKEYQSAEEIFSLQSCIFGKLEETEKELPEITKKIEEANKKGALLAIQQSTTPALQAELCAENAISSKTISADMKSGFEENLVKITSLLESIDNLKKKVEKMPE